MSESPQQKTKRTYKKRLLGNDFKYQYSIFYSSKEDALEAVESGAILRRAIARKYRNQPFLWRLGKVLTAKGLIEDMLAVDSPERIEMVYWSFFTTQELKYGALKAFIENRLEVSTRLKKRAVSEERLMKMANTIDRQKPHDLNKFFGLKKVNRMHCVNKDKFIEL